MKRMYLLMIVILLFPVIVNAEKCEVVSGDKNTIGSEVVCGTEHFYIIDSNDSDVKMLAKYNLYVGANYNKINLDSSQIYEKIECRDSECTSFTNNTKYYFDGEEVANYYELLSRIKQKYNLVESATASVYFIDAPIKNETEEGVVYQYRSIKVYPYEVISDYSDEYAMQNELALGVTGEKGNANYPIYATFNFFPSNNQNVLYIVENQEEYLEGYINIEFKDSAYIIGYLNDYKYKLEDKGYEVLDVDMLNIKDINELVHSISNKNLPLANWYRASLDEESIEEGGHLFNSIGDLKEYLSNDYKWLWNTSYWMKTIANSNGSYAYFVSSSGEICYSSTGCSGIPRAGLRPVVTISKDNIKANYKFIEGMGQTFNLNKNSNMKFRLNMEYEEFVDNGKIFIDDKEVSKVCYKLSKGSTIITFVDDCCKEYSLGSHTLRATLNNGEYEAVTNFIISSDVDLISKVKQIVENPNTSDKSVIIVIVAFISLLILLGTLRKKLFNRKYENI